MNGDMGFGGGNSNDILGLGSSKVTTPKTKLDKTLIRSGGQTITIKQTGAAIPKQVKTNSIIDNVEKLLEF